MALGRSVGGSWGYVAHTGTNLGNEISRGQLENYAQDIANRLHLGEKGLNIQEQKLIIDCITGLLNIAVQGGHLS